MGSLLLVICQLFAIFILSPPKSLCDEPETMCQHANGEVPTQATLILKNTNFIDVEKGRLVSHVDILINGSLIQGIYSHPSNKHYPDCQVIDLEGHYAIPGLIEGHTHLSPVPEKSLEIALKYGVTSLRDMAGDGEYLKQLQDDIKSGDLAGPDIYFSALMGGKEFFLNNPRVKLSTPPDYQSGEAPWMRLVDESSSIPLIIKEAKDCGATGIKLYAYLPAQLVRELSDEAKRQGLKVWAHLEVYPATPEEVVQAGVEVVSHVYFLLTPSDWKYSDGSKNLNASNLNIVRNKKLFSAMRLSNTAFDPTITVAREMFSSMSDTNQREAIFRAVYSIVRSAHESGVTIIAGTDIALPRDEKSRLPLHNEMEILVTKTGLTPMEAIRAATILNAEILGIDKKYGSVAVGKVANLVILGSNPLQDIYAIENVKLVIKNGKIVH